MTNRLYRVGAITILCLFFLLSLSACRFGGFSFGSKSSETEHSSDKIKLLVTEDGLYRATFAELGDHGLAIPASPGYDTLRLSSGQDSVPFLIDEESLVFYGQASTERYFETRPYILEVGEPGQAMAEGQTPSIDSPNLDHVRQTKHLEENLIYASEARIEEDSPVWFWSKLPQQKSFSTEITLPSLAEGQGALRLNAWGFTHNPQIENDHDLKLLVNDQPIGSAVWDGQVHHTEEIALPAGALQNGANMITVDNSEEGASFLDIVQLNWFEVDFLTPPVAVNDRIEFFADEGVVSISDLSGKPIVLDITDPAQPRHLQGWRYENGTLNLPVAEGAMIAAAGPQGYLKPQLAPVRKGGWKDDGHQADLIIVAAEELIPSLDPLVEAREAEGLGVAVVPVGDIYDEFGFGAPSPEGIHEFISYAYQNWQEPQPRYLLLVGDATSDFIGYATDPPQNSVPSPMILVAHSGETVSDSRLVDVDDDFRPDLAVGRWPVRTPQEVSDIVARTLAYEESTPSERAVFATDASESYFSGIADNLINDAGILREDVVQKDGPTAEELSDLWQQGAWLATYIGHGSIDRWGKEDMFNLDQLGQLDGSSVPIVVQLTCLTGLFSHPDQISLAEAMLQQKSGPVLVVAASSLTLSAHQEPFAAGLLQQLQDTKIQRFGDAFLSAKRALDVDASSGLREVSDTFALFGDPSARIIRP